MASLDLSRRYSLWDLDNCVSDDRHRIHLIDSTKVGDEKYEAYNLEMRKDPAKHVAEFRVITAISTPVFFTGRPAKFEDFTESWLMDRLDVTNAIMYMRPNGTVGLRPVMLKEMMLEKFMADFFVRPSQIIGGFDDIPAIVQMYAAHGIPGKVLQIHSDLSKVYDPADLV